MAAFLGLARCNQVVPYGRFGLTNCLQRSEKRKRHKVDTCMYNPEKGDYTNVLSLQE